jgi:CHAT domain-containing protein
MLRFVWRDWNRRRDGRLGASLRLGRWLGLGLVLALAIGSLPLGSTDRSAIAALPLARFSSGPTASEPTASGPTASGPTHLEQAGLAALTQGQWALASASFQQALAGYRQVQEVAGQVRCLSHLALADQYQGRMTEAQQWLAQARPLATTSRAKAQLLNTAGSVAFAQGQAQAAHQSWQEATALYQQLGLPAETLQSQLNQVQALQSLGFLPRAIALLEEIAPAIESAAPGLRAQGALHYGQVLQRSRRLDEAQSWYRKSLASPQNQGTAQSMALVGLGQIALQRNQPAQIQAGLDQLDRAIALAPQSPTAIQAQLTQLRHWNSPPDRAAFDRLWPRIQADLTAATPNHHSLYQRIELVQILLRQPEVHRAQPEVQTAIGDLLTLTQTQAEAIGDSLALAYSFGLQGQQAETAGQWAKAESLTDRALRITQQLQVPEISYRWQWQLGRLLSRRQPEAAIVAYEQAVTNLRQIHKDLVDHNSDPDFSFSRDVEPVYHELLGLLLPAQDKLTPLPRALSLHAESLLQEMRGAELDFYLQQGCDQPTSPANLAQMDPSAAVVYPIALDDRLAVMLRLADGQSYTYSAAVNRADLAKHLDRLRQDLVTRSRQRFLPGSQQLYRWLLAPMDSELGRQGVKTLVFVPDGPLQTIPMAALHDGKGYLLERYALAISPARPAAIPMRSTPTGTLAVGLSQARQGFSPLKFVGAELDSIRAAMPKSSLLMDQGFTGAALQSQVGRTEFPIVHIATHGQFSSTLDETFLLAWDQRILLRQIESLVRDRRVPLEMLVLSACETATGDDRAVLGLAGVAFKAGAQSTLATLWSVNDEASAAFTQEFYGNLAKPGTSRAEALRQAQIAMLQSRDYGHPLYWAAYVLLGSWL